MPFDVGKFHFGKVLSSCEVMFEMYSREYDSDYIGKSIKNENNSENKIEINVINN